MGDTHSFIGDSIKEWRNLAQQRERGKRRELRLCPQSRMNREMIWMEENYEQRTSEYAAGRATASIRSKSAVAGLSRAAAGSLESATRCMAGTAPRVESQLCRRVRAARALHCGTDHPGLRGRNCTALDDGPYRFRRVLELVRTMVAAAADCRGTGPAGRVGAGHEARDSRAADRQLHWDPDPAGGCGWN